MKKWQIKKPKQERRGFTLVEVIVVLVVLAILAAILIPALTGWIDKANEKTAIVGCRTCVTAAQTLASESYGTTGVATASPADVLALADVPGTVSSVTVASNGTIEHLTYVSPKNVSVLYCGMGGHPQVYNINASGGGVGQGLSSNGTNVGSSFTDAIGNLLSTPGMNMASNIDSTAASEGTGRTEVIAEYLSAMGIDLSAMNVQSWAIKSPSTNPKKATVLLTDQVVNDQTAGTAIRVVSYDVATKAYSVGYATIEKNGSIMRINSKGTVTDAQSAATYEEAVALFNQLEQTK